MKKWTRVLAILVVLLMVISIIGCSKTEEPAAQQGPAVWELPKDGDSKEEPKAEKASKEYKIGVVVPHLANPHFISQAYGYFDEAEKLGVKVTLFEAGGYKNLDRQLQQVEDLLAMPVDALVLVAVNGEGSRPMVYAANDKGVPVINVNVMSEAEEVTARVRSDDEEIGKMHAEYMSKKLNNKGNVLILAGPAGTSWAMGRSKGFEEYMKANAPDIKILEKRWLDSDPSAGMKEMEDALQAYPEINGVMTGSDMLGIGVGQALAAAGKAGEVIVTTTDSQPDCIKAIQDGKITATVVQSSAYMGRWGIKAAVMALDGKADQMVKRYWTPLHIVDKENAASFKFVGISQPPEGWQVPK